MNALEARLCLDEEWAKALEENDVSIDRLANSAVVAVRYALVTQPLGKIADSQRDT